MNRDKLYALALEYADETAISDIEIHCLRQKDASGVYWYAPWTATMNESSIVRKAIDYLDARIRAHNRLSAFAFDSSDIPPIMTRMQAVAESARSLDGWPLMVMDTAPAAVLGATLDPRVGRSEQVVISNVGNFHTLAFRLGAGGIEGVFEHHTGEIDRDRLDELITALADSTLRHEDVFDDEGHGALIYDPRPTPPEARRLAVTGPRRSLMIGSAHAPYFAVPYGDMMIAGCFGLVRAFADVYPEYQEAILEALSSTSRVAPWELL